MTFWRRPEVSRLFMGQEKSVAGRSPTDAKALRWEGSPGELRNSRRPLWLSELKKAALKSEQADTNGREFLFLC